MSKSLSIVFFCRYVLRKKNPSYSFLLCHPHLALSWAYNRKNEARTSLSKLGNRHVEDRNMIVFKLNRDIRDKKLHIMSQKLTQPKHLIMFQKADLATKKKIVKGEFRIQKKTSSVSGLAHRISMQLVQALQQAGYLS